MIVKTHKILWVVYGFYGKFTGFYGAGFTGFFYGVDYAILRVVYGALRVPGFDPFFLV